MRKKYLRIEEAAAEYGLDRRWLRSACLRKLVRASKVGRQWFVTPEAMDGLFAAGDNLKRTIR